MHPIAFELWGWPVHGYGLLAALGFLAALATWRWLDARGSGMPADFGSELAIIPPKPWKPSRNSLTRWFLAVKTRWNPPVAPSVKPCS